MRDDPEFRLKSAVVRPLGRTGRAISVARRRLEMAVEKKASLAAEKFVLAVEKKAT